MEKKNLSLVQQFENLKKIKKYSKNKKSNTSQKTSNKEKRVSSLDFDVVENDLKNCVYYLKSDEENGTLSIIIENIRLVSLNEIFATFQLRDYEVFRYKKNCHKLIDRIFRNYNGIKFEGNIKLTYFRSASRYFDNDALIASFKYFLDGIVENGIISDDNPNYVTDIKPIQQIVKGQRKSIIGIKIEKVKDEENTSLNYDPFIEWGIKEAMLTNTSNPKKKENIKNEDEEDNNNDHGGGKILKFNINQDLDLIHHEEDI